MAQYPIDFNQDEMFYFNMYVTNLTQAKKFYSEIFGFKLGFDGGEDVGWAEMVLPIKGVKIGLNLNPDAKINPKNNSIVMGVLDLDKTKQYIESKKVKNDEIQDIPNMISFFNCWDPFGNKIQFVGTPRIKSE